MDKRCNHCGLTKNISDFYKDKTRKDGFASTCKKCSDERTNQWNQSHRERRNAINRDSAEAHPESKRISHKAWIKAHPERVRERDKSYRDKWKEKFHARQAVKYALRTGKLIRQPCEICGNPKTHAHHDDYSKPLSIRWLCRKHHDEYHKKIIWRQI